MFRKMMITLGLISSTLFASSAMAGYSMGVCGAYTTCFGPYGPYQISCQVAADSYRGTACNWFVIPGRYIECNGVTGDGLWEHLQFSCN